MLSARQAWTLQGEIKGKIEMIDSLLKAGVGWDIISNATGITAETLQELKQKWQEMVGNVAQKGATGGTLSL